MTPTADQLYQAALALPVAERAVLAGRLIDSLPQDAPSQLHPAWRDELRRRLAQIDSGEVTPVPWDEVKRLAWEAVDRGEAAVLG